MRRDFWFDSCGAGRIHCCKWVPDGQPRAVVQIVHGIAEFIERYDDFANFLTSQGFVVVAEDHMGHGQSINGDGVQGYFHGGWFNGVADTYQLLRNTQQEYPGLPYILFGHSMGSFMARTILCKYPDSGISGAIICGSGWQPAFALPALARIIDLWSRKLGEKSPNKKLNDLIFGGYNNKVEQRRTTHDWLTRDDAIVDAYIAHPLCGFVPSGGLLRDMMVGLDYIEKPASLAAMKKDLPVYFIASEADPVGSYGKGIHQAVNAFRKAGMTRLDMKLYPMCRHEILNEINRDEVYGDVAQWIVDNI